MPDIHLACNVSKEPVNCPFFNFRAEGATAVRLSYGFKCSPPTTIVYTKLVSPQPIDMSYYHCPIPARTSFGGRATFCQLDAKAESVQSPRSLRTDLSRQSLSSYNNRTIIVYNVNTYAVVLSTRVRGKCKPGITVVVLLGYKRGQLCFHRRNMRSHKPDRCVSSGYSGFFPHKEYKNTNSLPTRMKKISYTTCLATVVK